MNKFKNTISGGLFFLALCLPLMTFSQDSQKSLDRDFNWNESNDTETVYINVEKGAEKLSMDFKGQTTSGDLQITAYDPEGNKVAGFTLICSGGDNSHVHVHTSGGSGSNASSGSNSNSNVHVTTGGSGSSSVVTTTTTSSSGESKTKRKHKRKHKDKDKGEYTYEVSNSGSKGAKGVMKKKITDPMPGQWKIVIETDNVTGTMEAEIDQD